MSLSVSLRISAFTLKGVSYRRYTHPYGAPSRADGLNMTNALLAAVLAQGAASVATGDDEPRRELPGATTARAHLPGCPRRAISCAA